MDKRTTRLTLPPAGSRLRILMDVGPYGRKFPFVPPIDAPELPMIVSFEGLSMAEQRTALAAFPGGKRFVLQG